MNESWRVRNPGHISCKGQKIKDRKLSWEILKARYHFANTGTGGKIVKY
jgi:hypothetical protein